MSELTQLEILQERLDVSAEYVIYGLFFSLILVFFGYLDMHLTNFIGIILPVYWTVKSIEIPKEADETQWLTYWSIFIPILISDLLFGNILKVIPFYYFIKLIFLIWLFLPNTRGALLLHNKLLIKYFGKIDLKRFNKILSNITNEFKEISISLYETVKEVSQKILEVDIEGRYDNNELQQPEYKLQSKEINYTENLPTQDDIYDHNIDNTSDIKKSKLLESDEPRSKEKIVEGPN